MCHPNQPDLAMNFGTGKDEDQILLKKVSNGNQQAFTHLFRKYWAPLFDAAYKRLQSREQAEELVQEIFMDVWQRRSSLTLTHSFFTYLSSALKYKILNQIRSEGVKSKHLQYLKTHQHTPLHPIEEKVYYDELNLAYEKALDQLPERCRTVFHLRRYEQRSFQEIANLLQISESTAEKHMVKALKLLRADLKDYVVTLPPLFFIYALAIIS